MARILKRMAVGFSLGLFLLLALTACSKTPVPTLSFAEVGMTMEVKAMASDLSISSVGNYNLTDGTVNITDKLLNGSFASVGEGYAYDGALTLPHFNKAAAYCTEHGYTEKGILLYHGLGYLAAQKEGSWYLFPISPDTDYTKSLTYAQMRTKAEKWQKNHGMTSGGGGLDE